MAEEKNKKEDKQEESSAIEEKEQSTGAENAKEETAKDAGKEEAVKSEKEEEDQISVGSFEDEPDDDPRSTSTEETEDLPEDIKKKLEKKKQEKGKKEKKGKRKVKKKKEKKRVEVGRAYVKATYNNTIVTLTDDKGGVISWASAGVAGFKGPKKATPYAAQIITKIACIKAKEEYGLKQVEVFVRGVGIGRDSAVRSLNANGLYVTAIKDITPVPHNGCRPPKPRRV
jgi:small subunit ribosomal protein S11